MRKTFSTEFINSIKKIPFVEGAKPVSFHFSIVYSKDQYKEPKNVLMVKYQKNEMKRMGILIQSPKGEVLKDINISNFNSIRIWGKNIYTDYDPEFRFFPSSSSYNLYTLITDNDVITVATNEQKDIKSIKMNHFIKLKSKILEYVNKIPDEIDDFDKCFVAFDSKIRKGYLCILFSNSGQETEINIGIFEDEENIIEELINDIITRKKKIDNLLTKGKMGGKDLIFCKLNKKRFLIAKCRRGNNDLLTGFTKKVIQKTR